MAIKTKEITFESEIEYSLIENGGYSKGNPADYNREYAIDTALLFQFLRKRQPKEWDNSSPNMVPLTQKPTSSSG